MRYFLQPTMICLLLILAHTSLAQQQLNILAWEGYTEADLVKEFEQKTGSKVDITLVHSDDELWHRVNKDGHENYDLIAVNTAELQRYLKKGYLRAINTAEIPNIQYQDARFQHTDKIPGLTARGQTFAIPYTYSEMGLIYNRKLVHKPPESITILWDKKYAGKILAFNTSNHNFTLAGISLGLPYPFQQTQAELNRSARHLVELRRNLLTFYSSPQEAVKLFKTQEIALIYANYGSQQLKALADVGADVGYALPKDGTLAWLDCWAIGRTAGPLAEQWINFMLDEKASQRLSQNQGLASTRNSSIIHHNSQLMWLEPIEDAEARNQLWEQIISGDVLERFAQ